MKEKHYAHNAFPSFFVELDFFMTDNEIETIAAQLEAEARVEDARFRIVQPGGGLDGSHIAANRAGYLRFSSLLLKAAIAPYQDNTADILDLEINDAVDPFSDVSFNRFERREDLWQTIQEKPVIEEENDRLFLFGCWLSVAIIAFLIFVGLISVLHWFSIL